MTSWTEKEAYEDAQWNCKAEATRAVVSRTPQVKMTNAVMGNPVSVTGDSVLLLNSGWAVRAPPEMRRVLVSLPPAHTLSSSVLSPSSLSNRKCARAQAHKTHVTKRMYACVYVQMCMYMHIRAENE